MNQSILFDKIKITKQRKIILDVFFSNKEHKSAEEIFLDARKLDKNISLTTVYRTLKIFKNNNLAISHYFNKNEAKYEPNLPEDSHHDHLICVKCGLIIEFINEKIESEQLKVAKQNKFHITHHKMELYGHCQQCA